MQLPTCAEHPKSEDAFELQHVAELEGVEILAWGMKKKAEPLNGKIGEVGVDASCGTHTKIPLRPGSACLEIVFDIDSTIKVIQHHLFCCLLNSTSATTIEIGKRKEALAAWEHHASAALKR